MSRTPRPRSSVPKPSPSGLRISPGTATRVTRHNAPQLGRAGAKKSSQPAPAPVTRTRTQMRVPVTKQRLSKGRGSPARNAVGGGQSEKGGNRAAGNDSAASELIHNLQQQIYFLEMETTYLRSNLGDGTVPPQATVDDQMRALTRAFRETEERYKVEAEETAKDLLRLQAELAKRDKAFRKLKQYSEEQQVLMETEKAQQAAEVQRGHEQRVAALKLAEVRKAEVDEAREKVQELTIELVSTKDEARDTGVRADAALAEAKQKIEDQGQVLQQCQEEVGRLTAENVSLATRSKEAGAKLQVISDELAAAEAARLAAVADLRNVELCRDQERVAHEARLADMKSLTEKIETLTAQLKTSEKNAEYMTERAERLEQSLHESNSERGTLRQRLKQAEIENTQLTKRVQIQHNQRVELSVQLASSRGESDTSNTRYEEALADMALCKKRSDELDAANTELQARCERLASEGMSLQDKADAAQSQVIELEAINVELKTRLSSAMSRLEKCKKIEDLDLSQMQTLMRSNLAVAKTLDTFMSIAGDKDDASAGENKQIN